MKPYSTHTDEQLKAEYKHVDTCRVKTGRNKGQIKYKALRAARAMVLEAMRRGHEYPHNWLEG